MSLRLFSLFGARRRTTPTTRRSRPQSFFRPSLEGLEVREVLSSPATLAPPALGPALVAQAHTPKAFNAVPLQVTGVSFQNGQLVVNGLLGVNPFTTTGTLTASPNAADPDCPILNLHLNPIHLNLLGLTVDTSAICLDVTAMPGPGNLLGNLLCDVANLLNGGTPLANVFGGVTSVDPAALTTGLTNVLNAGLGRVTSSSALAGATTNILHLSLGPVDLNLLGLAVHLDNCAGGPVTVDVGAVAGPGNLLGNLLTRLTHLLDQGANLKAVDHLLHRITHLIERLAGQSVFNLLPLQITGITAGANGGLAITGALGGHPFTTTGTLTAAPAAAADACPILHLMLGPIHLDLLGLTVDTSQVCLDITAMPGPGNLLGNLLCDVANLLNGGTPLGDILGGLTSVNPAQLTGALTNVLNEGLGQVTSSAAVAAATTNILHLSLGPVDLNLLGLLVHLDNCAGGPVTVDVGAVAGPGKLLGNLLTDLAHLLDKGGNIKAINRLLGEIATLIGGLI